jgi:hypothetical protein
MTVLEVCRHHFRLPQAACRKLLLTATCEMPKTHCPSTCGANKQAYHELQAYRGPCMAVLLTMTSTCTHSQPAWSMALICKKSKQRQAIRWRCCFIYSSKGQEVVHALQRGYWGLLHMAAAGWTHHPIAWCMRRSRCL